MMRVRTALAVGAMLAMAACGGGSDGKEPAAKPEPSATPTTTEVPRVSEATFCRLLFEGDENPVLDAAGIVRKFAADPDPTELDRDKVSETKSALESLAARAPESLASHVLAEADTLQVLIDAHDDPQDGQDVNFETFKSSGLEIATACGG